MTVRNDLSINYDVSPRIITIAAPSANITIQDLHDTLRSLEAIPSGIDNLKLVDSSGLEVLDSTTKVGITLTLQNALLAFQPRSGPTYEQCSITGGNIVAIDNVGVTFTTPISPTAFTQVVYSKSSAATQTDQEAIQYSSYGQAVNISAGSGNTGVDYPTYNVEFPGESIADAQTVAVAKGFIRVRVRGDFTFGATDVLGSYIYEGDNAAQSLFTFTAGVSTTETSFKNACLSGTLDGSIFVEDCALLNLSGIGSIAAISRFLNCGFEGGAVGVKLNNTRDIHFVSCENAASDAGINANGSTGNIRMQQYAGDLILTNLTAGNIFIFNTTGGRLTIDPSCSNSTVVLQGDAKYVNNGTNMTVEDRTSSALTWEQANALSINTFIGLS